MIFIYMLPAAILVPAIHEFVKALVSTLQGDRTPREHGYLTLNPFKYLEPIGFILVLMFSGFGWGNPTPTAALHYRNRQRGVLLTYTVPVLVTLVLGIAAIAAVPLIISAGIPLDAGAFEEIRGLNSFISSARVTLVAMLIQFGIISINFTLFNLIPIYPMAASRLIAVFGRPDTIARFNHYEKQMQLMLMLALILGIVNMIIDPISDWLFLFAWRLAV